MYDGGTPDPWAQFMCIAFHGLTLQRTVTWKRMKEEVPRFPPCLATRSLTVSLTADRHAVEFTFLLGLPVDQSLTQSHTCWEGPHLYICMFYSNINHFLFFVIPTVCVCSVCSSLKTCRRVWKWHSLKTILWCCVALNKEFSCFSRDMPVLGRTFITPGPCFHRLESPNIWFPDNLRLYIFMYILYAFPDLSWAPPLRAAQPQLCRFQAFFSPKVLKL